MEVALVIVLLGLLFDYTNGFHDAANVISTVVATRVLAPLTAIILAGILNALGATHVSGVAQTIANGLVDSALVTQGMMVAALLGAIFWNLVTWYFGIPSSSTYALIGGMVGAVWNGVGLNGIYWDQIFYKVVLPMIFAPFIGFFLALLLMRTLYYFRSRKRVVFKAFANLQVASASIVALSHGLNDAQKSMGVITLGLFAAGLVANLVIPIWVILLCALVMGIGTATGGLRIIKTIGFKITRITPAQGFAAESSASCVILAASFLGMPLSSSQTIVGSVTGVGAARGLGHIRWAVAKQIALTWGFTLPGSALFSISFFYLIQKIFNT